MSLKDLSVHIGADTSEFSKGMDIVSNEIQETQSTAEKSSKSLASQASSLASEYQKQGLNASEAFKKAWEEVKKQSAQTEKTASSAFSETTRGLEKSQLAVSAFNDSLNETISRIEQLSSSDIDFAIDNNIRISNPTFDNYNQNVGSSALADSFESLRSSSENVTSAFEDLFEGINGESLENVSGDSETDDSSGSIEELLNDVFKLAVFKEGAEAISDYYQSFADYESSVMRVNDIFNESSSAVSVFAKTTAKSLGMAESSVYEYASTYGNLFKNITSDTQENANITTAMLQASAVIASKTGRTMEDVMERIRSGLLGNTEAIEDLGINVNVAMLEVTDAFSQIADGRSWEQLSFYEQQQIRTLAILEQANSNFGDEISNNTAFALSTLSGAFKDLKVSIGELASGALTPVVEGLTILAQGATSVVNGFNALSSTTKTYLLLSLALAGGIPLVSLAIKGLAIAQTGLRAIQAILIPQTLTFTTVLKSAFGWASILASALGILYAIFSSKKKDVSDATKLSNNLNSSFDDTAISAQLASDNISDATDSISDMQNEIKNSLAGFDELNTLNGSNSGFSDLFDIDTSGIDNAKESLSELTSQDYNIDFDTNALSLGAGIKETFSQMWKDIKTLFSDWDSFWEEIGGGMYEGIENGDWEPLLTTLDEKTRDIFGDDWSEFWQDTGDGMYTGIEEGNWEPLLNTLDIGVRKTFGNRWADFWQEKGGQIYDGFHTGSTTGERVLNGLDAITRMIFGDKWSSFWQEVGGNMYTGIKEGDWEPLLTTIDTGVRILFGDDWSDFWTDVGSNMYEGIESGDWTPLLSNIEEGSRNLFGVDWYDFWQGVGFTIYEAFQGNTTDALTELQNLESSCRAIFGDGWFEFWEGVGGAVYEAFNGIPLEQTEVSLHGGGGGHRGINQYASGGMPTTGEIFIARERGPELVGRIGGSSAVANNMQIISGIQQGVSSALKSVMNSTKMTLGNVKLETPVSNSQILANYNNVNYNAGTSFNLHSQNSSQAESLPNVNLYMYPSAKAYKRDILSVYREEIARGGKI